MFKKREFAIIAVASFFLAVPVLASTVFNIDSDGNVGIGNSTPQNKLDVSGTIYSRLVTATTSTIDWSEANVQSMTLTSSPTLTFSNAQAGGEYKLIVNQDTTGNRTIAWPANVIWEDALAPMLSTPASSTDMVSFVYDGSHFLGTYALNFANGSTLLNDIVSYWKFEESSGNASDSEGANTLINNGPTYTTGIINNAAALSGSSEYFQNTSPTGIPTGDLTVNFWVKLAAQPSATQWGIVAPFEDSDRQFVVYYGDISGTKKIRVSTSHDGSSAHTTDFTQTLSNGTWYMITWVYTASTHTSQVYVDDSSLGTADQTDTSLHHAGTMNIGVDSVGNTEFDGDIDEVGIWSRDLTGSEISDLYNSGSADQYPF